MERLSLLSPLQATMAVALGLAHVWYPKEANLALVPPQMAPMATPPLLAPMAVAQGVFWPPDLESLPPRMGMGLAWASPRYPPMAMPRFSTVMSLALLLPRLAPMAAARGVYWCQIPAYLALPSSPLLTHHFGTRTRACPIWDWPAGPPSRHPRTPPPCPVPAPPRPYPALTHGPGGR